MLGTHHGLDRRYRMSMAACRSSVAEITSKLGGLEHRL